MCSLKRDGKYDSKQEKLLSMAENTQLNTSNPDEFYDIYISHNFDDEKLISGQNTIFSEMGFSILMDYTIQVMNKDVAEEKRYKISRYKADVCVTTGKLPNWGAWELAVAYGQRGCACILPIMDRKYKGDEFYPYIELDGAVGLGKKSYG